MKSELKQILDIRPDMQPYLFSRGFLITDANVDEGLYPLYGNWNKVELGGYSAYVHEWKNIYVFRKDGRDYFLIGHAYDPFAMQYEEEELLRRVSCSSDVWKEVSNWTGVFCVGYVEKDMICFSPDAAGQQLIYYGTVDSNVYIASHSQLVGELLHLDQSEYIKRLMQIKFFHAFGYVLPGDLSPFSELKRAQCNFYTKIDTKGSSVHRFWPVSDLTKGSVRDMADVIHNNMQLIAEKWPDQKAAISVTGGMDSKTTLACTNGLYDRFQYFSYDSLPDEKVDADAAHELCGKMSIQHKIYTIPTSNEEIYDFEIWNELLFYNCGCIGYVHSNDVRKRAYFSGCKDFDIEVKSWVDEIGRARYHKRFAKKSFPVKLTARYLSSIYKPFITERKLLRQTDEVFEDYLNIYYGNNVFDFIPWWDLIYWEFEWNAGEGAFLTGEHVLSYDITIPFNNRRLLEMMLTVPLKKRIDDVIQKRIIRLMNPNIEKTGIHVQDVSHTRARAYMERAYLELNTRLPF